MSASVRPRGNSYQVIEKYKEGGEWKSRSFTIHHPPKEQLEMEHEHLAELRDDLFVWEKQIRRLRAQIWGIWTDPLEKHYQGQIPSHATVEAHIHAEMEATHKPTPQRAVKEMHKDYAEDTYVGDFIARSVVGTADIADLLHALKELEEFRQYRNEDYQQIEECEGRIAVLESVVSK
jgi:hypothetical protein